METAYLETTIFSFYYDERTAPAIVAMRDWTRQFRNECETKLLMVTSAAALDELRRGDMPHKQAALRWALALPIVPAAEDEIVEIVRAYMTHKLMPTDPAGDALHLALASFHECDYLVTWNCRHLANARKFGHIRHVNRILGLKTPNLVTPIELLGENDL